MTPELICQWLDLPERLLRENLWLYVDSRGWKPPDMMILYCPFCEKKQKADLTRLFTQEAPNITYDRECPRVDLRFSYVPTKPAKFYVWHGQCRACRTVTYSFRAYNSIDLLKEITPTDLELDATADFLEENHIPRIPELLRHIKEIRKK